MMNVKMRSMKKNATTVPKASDSAAATRRRRSSSRCSRNDIRPASSSSTIVIARPLGSETWRGRSGPGPGVSGSGTRRASRAALAPRARRRAGGGLGGSVRGASDDGVAAFSAEPFCSSTRISSSSVLRSSLEARRNSPMLRPSERPSSGSLRGPKMMSAITRMMTSSGMPMEPNMYVTPVARGGPPAYRTPGRAGSRMRGARRLELVAAPRLSGTMKPMRPVRSCSRCLRARRVAIVGGLFGRGTASTQDQIPDRYRAFTTAVRRSRPITSEDGRVDRLVYSAISRHAADARPALELLRPARVRADARAAGRPLLRPRHHHPGHRRRHHGGRACSKGRRRTRRASAAATSSPGSTARTRRAGRATRRSRRLRGPKGTTVAVSLQAPRLRPADRRST